MRTIVVNSQKGGSGKTSVCAHVAVEAEQSGDGPVYLIDADRQGTLGKWHLIRTADKPHRVEIELPDLASSTARTESEQQAELQAIRDGLDFGLSQVSGLGGELCFIDTPPTRNENMAAVFELADLVLVPVRPSPSDLWAVSATVAMLKRVGAPFLFVVNQATVNANITAQAIAALSHHGPVAQTIIGTRVHYAAAMTDGHTAPELAPRGPAAQEIAALWMNIKHACMQACNKTKVTTHA